MKKILLSFACFFVAGSFVWSGHATSQETNQFTVMVYNVENLFDLDGVSIFDEYNQNGEENAYPYTPAKLFTKVCNAADIIAKCNSGQGAEIVAIQEFENDFTQDSAFDLSEALDAHESVSLQDMLLNPDFTNDAVLKYPIEFFLLKRLSELGVKGYEFYQPSFDSSWFKRGIAHRCVFLSRYPVTQIHQYPLEDARDILEATFNVAGHPFTIFNNHWKSGASSSRSEPTRVQNATVLRQLVDQRLAENPEADILLVGDFNSHHNQQFRMDRPVETTGLNGVLLSQSSERALLDGDADLYNLWYELPQQQRGSEVWRGEWGTLMQMMVTPGLYDETGIQYVDGSFNRFGIVGMNLSKEDATPVSWVNLGNGAGYSDHLPVVATFRYENEGNPLEGYQAKELGDEIEKKHIPIKVNFSLDSREILKSPETLSQLSPEDLAKHIGTLYYVVGEKAGYSVVIGDTEYSVYMNYSGGRNQWNELQDGKQVKFVGSFGIYRGQLQFVVEAANWFSWRP